MARTISLLNMKGGVGKTTLSVNLAWHFYEVEKSKVLLVDLDPQFNSTQYVMDFKTFDTHRKKNGTITDLLQDSAKLSLKEAKRKENPSSVIYTVQKTKAATLDLLPAELSLAWIVKNPAQMEHRLEILLKKLEAKYDYIFIDCAPTDSVLTTMALTASDFVLIPMRPDRFSILGFANLMETVRTFRNNCPNPHNVKTLGVVFTQVTNKGQVEAQNIAEIKNAAQKEKTPLFTAVLTHSPSFARALADQSPIFLTKHAHQKSKGSVAKVATEMLSHIKVLDEQASSSSAVVSSKIMKKKGKMSDPA